MSSETPISVISSFATNVTTNGNREPIGLREVGPALYIRDVLQREAVPYELTTYGSEKENTLTGSMLLEGGLLCEEVWPQDIVASMFREWTIISTVAREWRLPPGLELPERLFLDTKGFAHNPVPGDIITRERFWDDVKPYARQVFAMRVDAGTRYEFDTWVLDEQKKRLLLITGGNDAELYYRGQFTRVRFERIWPPVDDYVGEDDTYFAAFAAAMYKGAEPEEAARVAGQKRTEFLRSRAASA